jgi:hypothetical protein
MGVRDRPDSRGLAAGPLRLEARLHLQHHHLVALHLPAGVHRLLRSDHRDRAVIRPSLPARPCGGSVLPRERPHRGGMVPHGRARHRLGDLQLGAVLRDGDVRAAHRLDHLPLRLALRLLRHGRDWFRPRARLGEGDLQPEGAPAGQSGRARAHPARRRPGRHGPRREGSPRRRGSKAVLYRTAAREPDAARRLHRPVLHHHDYLLFPDVVPIAC